MEKVINKEIVQNIELSEIDIESIILDLLDFIAKQSKTTAELEYMFNYLETLFNTIHKLSMEDRKKTKELENLIYTVNKYIANEFIHERVNL